MKRMTDEQVERKEEAKSGGGREGSAWNPGCELGVVNSNMVG